MTATVTSTTEGHARLGFACHWTDPRQTSWSGTPWNLRLALDEVAQVQDVEVGLSDPERQVARLLSVRRTAAARRLCSIAARSRFRISEISIPTGLCAISRWVHSTVVGALY